MALILAKATLADTIPWPKSLPLVSFISHPTGVLNPGHVFFILDHTFLTCEGHMDEVLAFVEKYSLLVVLHEAGGLRGLVV
jgi:hypothetical protein